MNQTIPEELQYSTSHEWVRTERDGTVTVGVTDYAQSQLGDVVFVELPRVGKHYVVGGAAAVLESVKAAADVYAPLTGDVLAVNEQLSQDPGLLNRDPYGEGWLFRLHPVSNGATELMDATTYATLIHP
ncbi:MAG: glycine cleavage system protein H [Gammaproteobacteria bacterium RIFCSPHIGHO2_12_FULL_45_9]|nr:MAG: glycine cleavage system protein H [Gammaproteobacteria bacterium RIFCSPHIGHO2_12_FULL_45_9]